MVTLPYCNQHDGNGVDDVERIDAYLFYQLALDLHSIFLGEQGTRSEEVPLTEALFPLINSKAAIVRLIDGTPIPLGVSKSAAEDLRDAISQLLEQHFQDEQGKFKFPIGSETETAISGWQWSALRTTLGTFETIFRAEMGDAITYQIPERGIYSTPKLVNMAEQTFLPELIEFLGDKAQKDFNAAGRCLAFNLLTAAGFHVVRAVEGTLENYYQTFTGKKGTLNSWHDYIAALKSVAVVEGKSAPDEKTINLINQIKDDYRNPVVHPRVVLTEADARIIFSNGEAAIMGMAQEIKRAQEQNGFLPIPAIAPAKSAS